MTKRTRLLVAAAGMVLTFALITTAEGRPAAKSKSDSGTAYVSITHTTKLEFAAGNNSDKVLGNGAITYQLTLAGGKMPNTIKLTSKKVVLYTSTGALTGTGSAIVTIVAGGNEAISGGKLSLTKGSGSQKGHSLTATFTGIDHVTPNQIVFNYKGTYK